MEQNTPQPARARTSPKDFFLHLLAMVALYASAVSFGAVVFQLINLWIPDTLDPSGAYYFYDNARVVLRRSLSFLIVMFPAYVWVSWMLHKSYLADMSKVNLRVRKWLINFTLFAAALVILFSLVSLINHLLDGELTLRFSLKVLTVFFISGSVFGYYLWDVKKYRTE
jgi:hypothetical protein